jgi:hypothetical protein
MEWVSIVIISGWEDDLDGLVSREDEGVLGRVEVAGLGSAVNDLLESGNLGREVGYTVDVPLSLAGSLKS